MITSGLPVIQEELKDCAILDLVTMEILAEVLRNSELKGRRRGLDQLMRVEQSAT
jgi:hypothetical protein